MNKELIQKLFSKSCWDEQAEVDIEDWCDVEEFAELIVRECVESLTKVWYEQGMDIRGAEIGKFLTRFNEHFGVKE